MAASSALVPIIVAVIGVVGAVVPAVYVNSQRTQSEPDVAISGQGTTLSPEMPNKTMFFIYIDNELGNAAATNLTLILEPELEGTFAYIENDFSTTDVVLPQDNNTVLESGSRLEINQSFPLKIYIPVLVHGIGSSIRLVTQITCNFGCIGLIVHSIYDQGSDKLEILNGTGIGGGSLVTTKPELSFTPYYYYYYYIIFYGSLAGTVVTYIWYRRKMRRFPREIAKKVMEIRRVLRSDHHSRTIFPEIWDRVSERKRRTIDSINDYLLIDDFNSELRKRNSYLSSDTDRKESDLSRTNTLAKLNEAILAAAENVLNKVDWNKYR